ncbi:hypothetical protein TNCT_110361 [Trichonephila clavata]|uniref:Uncharacterized protein n=1 Tax=Trichonephila clavata TaxID=2740835 RepID=A0A8X6LA30_TRICU|nr:hypothetical protein TNCT_110361 [Trichonephila clavata]
MPHPSWRISHHFAVLYARKKRNTCQIHSIEGEKQHTKRIRSQSHVIEDSKGHNKTIELKKNFILIAKRHEIECKTLWSYYSRMERKKNSMVTKKAGSESRKMVLKGVLRAMSGYRVMERHYSIRFHERE